MTAFTKKAIGESFIKLLNEKPLDKITVKEIIEDCGINRSTFYYHFEDIYDLLNQILEAEANKISSSHMEFESWVDGVTEAMSFAIQNKTAIYHIYKSVRREQLEKYLHNIFDFVMKDALEHYVINSSEGINVKESDMQIIIDLYKYALCGLVFKWLEEGMDTEPIEQVRRLGVMLEGNIQSMLLKAEKYDNQK